MRPPTKSLVIASIGILALSLSACTTASLEGAANSAPVQETTSAVPASAVNKEARALLPVKVRDSGVLRIASDPTYPPFELYKGGKQIVGWDIDLGDAIAEVLGVKAEHVAATFDTILPGLSSAKYDLGMSAFSMTPERSKAVDFVKYLSSGTGLAVPAGNPKSLTLSASSLCGRPIGTQKGTSQALEILPGLSSQCTAAGQRPIDSKQFPTQSDANLALLSGRVEGVLAGSPSLAYQGKLANHEFELAPGDDVKRRPIGIALPKKSALTPAIQAAFDIIVANGTYAQVNEKWGMPATSVIDPAQAAQK